ncbi:MAG: damage-control phosphatase ARMT1 family protein [Candidatus Hodarchaeales archaeon]
MQIHLDCIPCLQKQVLQAAQLATDNKSTQEQILREVLKVLQKSEWNTRTILLAYETQAIVSRLTGNEDPYSELKAKYNKIVLDLYPQLQNRVQSGNDPLLTACKLAIAGNIIDFGALKPFDINKTIDTLLNNSLTVNHLHLLRERLNKANSLIYLADNTGEIVFDKLLLETILMEFSIDKVIFVIKKDPILNDAMRLDADVVGITSIPQVELYEVGRDRRDPSFLAFLQNADVVISKGQANFEDLHDIDYIFFLLILKCEVIAKEVGFPEGSTLLSTDSSTFIQKG